MKKLIPEKTKGVYFSYSDEQLKHWVSVPASSKIRLIESARLLSELAQSKRGKAIRNAFREGKI